MAMTFQGGRIRLGDMMINSAGSATNTLYYQAEPFGGFRWVTNTPSAMTYPQPRGVECPACGLHAMNEASGRCSCGHVDS